MLSQLMKRGSIIPAWSIPECLAAANHLPSAHPGHGEHHRPVVCFDSHAHVAGESQECVGGEAAQAEDFLNGDPPEHAAWVQVETKRPFRKYC